MLFVFLLDKDKSMSEINFSQYSTLPMENINNLNFLSRGFYPNSMDVSLYFIQQYSKLICDNLATRRNFDETSFIDRDKSNKIASSEHRFILLTFNEHEGLQLRSSWKDSYATLQEELKNISHESRSDCSTSALKEKYSEREADSFIKGISEEFEDFMDKFEASYFNCSVRTGGHFIFKESESVFIFSLSHDRTKLQRLNENFMSGWQRRNIFIQMHPDSFTNSIQNLDTTISSFNFFPVTNLRDSDQLARTLYHANNFNSFETVNMELLGLGGLVDFVFEHEETSELHAALMRPRFTGKPKWPVPNSLTDENWTDSKPKLIVCDFPSSNTDKKSLPLQFDEYITYSPSMFAALKAQASDSAHFLLKTKCKLGSMPFGYCVLVADEDIQTFGSFSISPVPLVKVFIGPFNFLALSFLFQQSHGKHFLDYLRNIPQFYEYFFQSVLGDAKYFELCRQRSWRNEFILPQKLVESKNMFRSSFRQKCKNDLGLLVEKCDNSHRWRVNTRQNTYKHSHIFPSLRQLKNDCSFDRNFNRLKSKFKNSLQVFMASCDSRLGCSPALHQSQLPQVLFKHSLPVNQMTDFSEVMRKKRQLRPLFTEGEKDLFLILREMPALQEEMAGAHFVNGDIFGNPYRRETRKKKKTFNQSTLEENILPSITDESSNESFSDSDCSVMSPISIDEIDYKEMEDIDNEIFVNGSIVNLPVKLSNSNSSDTFDFPSFERLIRSPGGLSSKIQFIESLSIVCNIQSLHKLLELCIRYKRISFASLISDRIRTIDSQL
jgi:hypothetical protein